jgi:hypothetical protein
MFFKYSIPLALAFTLATSCGAKETKKSVTEVPKAEIKLEGDEGAFVAECESANTIETFATIGSLLAYPNIMNCSEIARLSQAVKYVNLRSFDHKVSIKMLRHLKKVESLNLILKTIADFENIAEFSHIQNLSLEFGSLKSVEPLKGLKNLKQLSIRNADSFNLEIYKDLEFLESFSFSADSNAAPKAYTAENCPTETLNKGLNKFCIQMIALESEKKNEK